SDSPPVCDVAGKGYPQVASIAQGTETREEKFVHVARALVDEIVRMANEAHQPMPRPDHLDLLFPNRGCVVVKNVKQRIVLHGRERKLHEIANEIGKDRATSAALRLEMRDVGNRHVVRELECVKPVL